MTRFAPDADTGYVETPDPDDEAAQPNAADRDAARMQAELRHRIDHAVEVGVDFEAVLRWVAHERPDVVNEALDEHGAPA